MAPPPHSCLDFQKRPSLFSAAIVGMRSGVEGGLAMSDGEDGRDGDLSERIERARDAMRPKRSTNVAEKYNALSLAWRMTIELVMGVVIGAAVGLGLDTLTGLKPLFLIVFGLLGFAAGVKVVMETAKQASQMGRDAEEDENGRGPRA